MLDGLSLLVSVREGDYSVRPKLLGALKVLSLRHTVSVVANERVALR